MTTSNDHRQVKFEKVPFKNVGRQEQHEVTLFEILQRPVKMHLISEDGSQSYAENLYLYFWDRAKAYLKLKGFDDTAGLFQVVDGKIIKYNEETGNIASAVAFWAAIEERDRIKGGQQGEYLAALIDYTCQELHGAWLQVKWHNSMDALSFILDKSLEVQELFFDLYLLENVQRQFSAGEMRIENANKAADLKSVYYSEIEVLYIEYRSREPRPTKENCYKWIAQAIKNNHPEKKTPTAGTIKNYLKSKKDLS